METVTWCATCSGPGMLIVAYECRDNGTQFSHHDVYGHHLSEDEIARCRRQ